MSSINFLAALILSLLICLGLVYLSFKSIELDSEDDEFENSMNGFELLPHQFGYFEARGWR